MEAACNCVTATSFFVTIHSGCTLEKEGRYFIYEVTCDQAILLPFGAVFKVQGQLHRF